METGSGFSAQTGGMEEEHTTPPRGKKEPFHFPWNPKEIKAHLDRFVIKQEEAKKVLSIAVCDHYHHVQAVENGESAAHYAKQNVVLMGPTGVGKTYLIKCLADLIRVPLVRADATKFTETGYVGGDVEDLVRDLVHQANGDMRAAQYGIIYLDEVDKLASASTTLGRDVSGRGVQTNLLKLMEETEVPLRSQTDLQSQLQAAMEFQRRGKIKREVINTRHILFIVSGAFDRLPDIVSRRLSRSVIGFQTPPEKGKNAAMEANRILTEATTPDFIDYGFEPEFIGRLPVRVACQPLDVSDLFRIMKNSEGSLIHQYEAAFKAYGIEVIFTDDGLTRLAELAAEEKTGARGLMTICEQALRNFKFELPGTPFRKLVINRELVDNPEKELARLLSDGEYSERLIMEQMAHEFSDRFFDRHQLRLLFEPEAIHELVDGALREHRNIREYCQSKFKDFEFGLKLIQKNSGRTEFVIDRDVIQNPERSLSEWVVKSYQRPPEDKAS